VLLLVASCLRADDRLTISIHRNNKVALCQTGEIIVNDNVRVFYLERTVREELLKPLRPGTYTGTLYSDSGGHWRLTISIGKSKRIEFHLGSMLDQTEPYLLVGIRHGNDLCTIIDTPAAVRKLEGALRGTGERPVQVTIVNSVGK